MTAGTDVKALLIEENREHLTPRQWEILEAIDKAGTQSGAAKALGVAVNCVNEAYQASKKKLAKVGRAPGHFNDGTAPGYRMGKVTVQRGPGGVERVWERQHPEREGAIEAVRLLVAEMCEPIRGRAPLVKAPDYLMKDMLVAYKFGDPHFGMASGPEAGGDEFDIDEADRLTRAAIDRLVAVAPPTETCIVEVIGDAMHANDSSALTPAHKNRLDVDKRGFSYALLRCARAWQYVIERALEHHQTVHVWFLRGNHDEDAAEAIKLALAFYFEREPRVVIDLAPAVFRYLRFGKNLLGAHHGDKVKMDALPLLMAVDAPEDWGATVYRYITTGHIHHDVVKEIQGVRVESLRTLAPKDPYHAFKGYRSLRDTRAVAYHAEYGEAERYTVSAAMLSAAA